MRKNLAIILFFAGCCISNAQTKMFTVQTGPISFSAIDRVGDLYVVRQDGKIIKYDVDGKAIAETTLSSAPTDFNPWDPIRNFAYYRDRQVYDVLDQHLAVIQTQQLAPQWAITPYLVCGAEVNRIWLLDAADWSLKKINVASEKVETENKLILKDAHPLSFTAMREYQNFIFLYDPLNGLYIYNTLGILMHTLTGTFEQFGFLGQEVYYRKKDENRLSFFDLIDGTERTIDLPEPAIAAWLTDDRMIIVKGNEVTFYLWSPP